jgi:phage shock protein PspC (stress-responsive transcriptional regulator)
VNLVEASPWPPPATDAAADPIGSTRRADDGAILAGVASELGARTGADPLWFRIAFVVLAVFSGLGVLLYLGSWLILRGRRRSQYGPMVIAGAAVIVVSCVLLLENGTSYIASPWTIVFVLAGIAVALWQPRAVPESVDAVAVDRAPPPTSAATATTLTEPRPPSVLGRWTLALALLVGAAGAIGYQLDGDGLHPERWLGAAAAVCGIGMVVGAWRGRALWLVVPALLFAGSGFVAGHAARAGIDGLEAGTRYHSVGSVRPFGLPEREDLVAGKIEVTVFSAPPNVARSDLRVGLGEIDLIVDDDSTIDVRAHVYDGDIVINGVTQPNDGDVQVIRIGPGATAEAVISATVSVGRLEITERNLFDPGRLGD